jgi:PBP1b-binding outer membrane lipoprotein LpoB
VRLGLIRGLTASLLLSGCATAPSEVVCPIPKDYSLEIQRQAANELESLPVNSVVASMISDYGVVREELRACLED